ncbi:MAG TPA: dienelactone hydrolase family protein [Blastocatellia bacterium]|nr:dienelactone hydrolase family protein [Blastocatellia bacterium]
MRICLWQSLARIIWLLASISVGAQELPGTAKLTTPGDLALEMVAGMDRFVMRELEQASTRRAQLWQQDFSSLERYAQSIAPNRQRFLQRIGVVDARVNDVPMELVSTTEQPALVAEAKSFTVHAVRWQALAGVYGEGLLLQPRGQSKAVVIALGDADHTPEMMIGLVPGIPAEAQFARKLAEQGCTVLIPVLMDRADTWSGNARLSRMTNQPHREFVYRLAYEMGRHVIGYEVQKILAAVDWCRRRESAIRIGVFGYGEGGLLALYSGAADARIDAVGVSGYFQSRQDVWREPVYRNVWGLLEEFGDAELAALIAPRPLLIEASRGIELAGPPPERTGRRGAAPGRLASPTFEAVRAEFARAQATYQKLGRATAMQLTGNGNGQPGAPETLRAFLAALNLKAQPRTETLRALRASFDPAPRQQRQFTQLLDFTQTLVRQSEFRRAELLRDLLTSKLDQRSTAEQRWRDYFHDEVIGRFPAATLPLNARSRRIYQQPNWTGYEVTLDVWSDVFAYGILLLPNDLKPGERRPVVVCQHGLEGRPQDVADPSIKSVYRSFGAQLVERGFIVFAPQNPYIGKDQFRVLQRKLNPLRKSLFSVIVRQHERILEWLAAQPFVDAARIGFYGLSYGGKTAMRVPALLPNYALSICSGDFNEWIVKNTTLDHANSYLFTGEYEMPEFNLGHTFNYAEMAALIAPRPFMVERGHHDGVGIDELVAYEYAKVRRMYAGLGLPNQTRIEFFNGGHEIHGQGTFAFLHEHLRWPQR